MKKSYLLLLLPLLFCSLFAQATIHTVTVQNFQFTPANITTVHVGDTIKWTWVNGSHTTTSQTIPAGAASWNSAMSQNVQTFMYKVTTAGIYNYVCTPHMADMKASFTASAVSGIGEIAAAPVFKLKGSVVTDEIIIDLDIIHGAQVNIQLYNLVGRLVRTFSNDRRDPGTYQENYSVADLPKGLYLLSVAVGKQHTTLRVIVQ